MSGNQLIAIIFQQIEDCQKLAATGGTPFTAAQIIKAAETLVLYTGKYTQSYWKWLALSTEEKTYKNFKVCFAQEYQVQNKLFPTTVDAGFHDGNIAEIEATDYNEIMKAVTNFMNAAAADRDTFNTLTTTNAQLQQQIAVLAEQDNVLQEMMCLLMTNSNNNLTPTPSPNPHPVPPPTPHPPFQQHLLPTIGPFGRDRGRGRRRGCQVRFGQGRERGQPPPSQ